MVVIGHLVRYDSPLGLYIYCYHMPLFFMISGICLNENKYENIFAYIRVRIRQRILPAISFTLFIFIASNILFKPNAAYHIQDVLKGFPHALWFLGILFIVEILYYLLHKTLNINTVFIIAVTIPLGFFLATPGMYKLPYEINAVPLSLLFYSIGCFLSVYIKLRCRDKIQIIDAIIYILLFMSPLYATLTHSVINMSEIDKLFPDYLIMATGCLGCTGMGKILEKSKALAWFGQNSLVIMAVHLLYMHIAIEFVHPYIDTKIIYKIAETAIVFSLSVLSVLFINKKALWIIGK